MRFVLAWLPFVNCAFEFRQEMTWRPVLTGLESGFCGWADPPFTKPEPAGLHFSFLSYFLQAASANEALSSIAIDGHIRVGSVKCGQYSHFFQKIKKCE